MRPCREIEPYLSQLVDGELPDDLQADVRAHLRECAACRGLLTDLERLKASARSLGPMPPPHHVWQHVEAHLRQDGDAGSQPPAHSSGRQAIVQWVGLAAALFLVTTVIYVARGRSGTTGDGGSSQAAVSDGATDEVGRATVPYEDAIRELEALTKGNEDAIAPDVVTVVRTNLGAIDTAIADSRAAVAANPESESARDSLFEALRRKIALLQTTVSLINDMRAGNQEGAAEAAEQLGKQS